MTEKYTYEGKTMSIDDIKKNSILYNTIPIRLLCKLFVKKCSDSQIYDITATFIKNKDSKRLYHIIKELKKRDKPIPTCYIKYISDGNKNI